MMRIEKEIFAIMQKDIGHACMIAKATGHDIIAHDGDGENGMCAPSVEFMRGE